ncbi:MAG TPA: aminopeptidase N [Tetrasphaera sp.]|uniref:aminopeptidase N n=1 Tax=Nostocoides sp. TaxID=1917966 RepID=UPI002B8B8AA1|nr:aminopeptidase N [Tetrasphaera sp.]HNQ06202.1 aminopeptidase N [Tetrasphaera sp.]
MPGTNLTRAEAQDRAAIVATESYVVKLDLTTSPETFRSVTTVRFTATPGASSFIDLIAPSVEAITLNGESLDPATHFADSRISLPDLAAANELVVDATCAYMNTGEGLHRFVDPVDNEVYLYTQFEVPDSRRIMAVFEQPDLKATFAFSVTGPDHWQVVSNAITPQPEPAGPGTATWTFPATGRISSYITALVAGPYAVVRDSVQTRAGTIDLGVFCRTSMLPHLDADNVLAVTKAGFGFFEEMFDAPYPFTKYDQLFTPEYNMGAMENAGCVTINELYVFRGKVPDSTVERRALTILHELAHMWFGDLVTMKWWDDLWLNESFAEWASTVCQAEATGWHSAWTTFCTHEKAWAYRQDQLSSTHPIVAPIRDLHDVEVNFDGITYAKGASVLKQLVAYVGRDPFVAGLRTYFAKHAWSNTTLGDLLIELEAASGRDLRTWAQLWLETAGVNVLTPQIDSDDRGLVSAASIAQTCASGDQQLRPHRLVVGTYDVIDGAFVRTGRHELDVDGDNTPLPMLIGQPRPALVLVNDEDLAYAKIRFDERSLATVLAHPRGFAETLPHSLAVATVWDMTRDGEMAASDYLPYALAVIDGERDSALLRNLLAQVHTCLVHYLAPEHRDDAHRLVIARGLELAQAAPAGSDAQLQLVTAYAALIAPGDDTTTLAGLYDGSVTLPGLSLDTDMRWTLLTGLVAAGAAGDEQIQEELERDNTSTGRERAARARASAPTPAAKAVAWACGVEDVKTPNSVIQALAAGFNRATDPALLQPYMARFLDGALGIYESRTHAIAEEINGFYPAGLAGPDLLAATNAWLEEHTDAPAAVQRVMAENRDGVARAVAAQERDRAGA